MLSRIKYFTFLVTACLCILSSRAAHSQTHEGQWYIPLRNKLLSIIVTRDSVHLRKYPFENPDREAGDPEASFKIERSIAGNDEAQLLVSYTEDTASRYFFFGFENDALTRSLYLSIESMNEEYATLADAGKAASPQKKQKIRIPMLRLEQIHQIQAGKALSQMSADDFRNYAHAIMQHDSTHRESLRIRYRLNYLYAESETRIILAELGFNALVNGNEFDAMLERFSKDWETRTLFEKAFGKQQ